MSLKSGIRSSGRGWRMRDGAAHPSRQMGSAGRLNQPIHFRSLTLEYFFPMRREVLEWSTFFPKCHRHLTTSLDIDGYELPCTEILYTLLFCDSSSA
ncbi:hypothetical protein NPIL_669041 [Nephila pilipes]|uniref:Uncharacterized protein n=1 Tax=Nephila pilipes TaxID=299642 RepID=A0A8X6M7Q5_NEPPI|nr:hypothetical protein NPIL_669041 [Nephila pilipes]